MHPRFIVFASFASAVALAACSSSSTGLAAGPVGNWHVTVSQLAGSGIYTYDIRPAPFVLTISQSSATYTATFPALFGITTSSGDTVHRWSQNEGASLVVITADSLRMSLDDTLHTCTLTLVGAINGTSASGSGILGNCDGPGTPTPGSWSATKF
ncbi:MAG TPA: hypothetical protein VFU75_03650 [Gemmatimonadales bacterium]|nr:hypothetical protein [Gemmatimonadales bacterium]